MPRKISPKRIARLQTRYLRQEGASEAEIRRWRPYLTAQIGAESNFTQGVGSPAGARDIAQFMPGTAPGYGVKLGDGKIKDDIRGQVRYMLPLLRKHGVEGALRGYNAGPGAIDESKRFSETNNYVQRIESTVGRYRGGRHTDPPVDGHRPGPQYRTIPGEDFTDQRQAAMLSYLDERGKPGALLELKGQLDAYQDTPDQTVTVPGEPSASNRSRRPRLGTPHPTSGKGRVIGTPHSGTHTLGNWQSDNALDIRVPNGTAIRASTSGKVVKVSGSYEGGASRFDGYQVTIEGPNGGLFYTHLMDVNVKAGQRVKRGQVIGKSGSANGVPHLHFGVEKGDPRRFIGG